MRCHAWITALALCLFAASPGLAEKRAFIVGNSQYDELGDLQNTLSDASAYAETFSELGYEVSYYEDLDLDNMGDRMDAFLASITAGDEIAFIFSGHGWSDGSTNYLVPTDAPASGIDRKLKRLTMALRNGHDGILDEIEASGAGLVLAVIDACRNNPFTPPKGRKSSARSRGLARVTAATGTFVVFSAGEGQEALDRLPTDGADQKLSVFSRNFIPRLRSGVYLEDAISEAQLETAAMARSFGGHLQHPAYYDQTLGKTCLSGQCERTNVVQPTFPAQCKALYEQSRSPRSCDDLKAFIASCGAHPEMSKVAQEYAQCLGAEMTAQMEEKRKQDEAAAAETARLLAAQAAAAAKSKAAEEAAVLAETPEAIYQKGNNYYYGRGVSKDFAEAAKLFRKAAERGHVPAQRDLGSMYDFGKGVKLDYLEAALWYRKAANAGDSGAQSALGYLYANGQGVAKDDAEAVRLYRASAEQGHAVAQYNLGRRYATGEGVGEDLAEATRWYQKSADQGDDDAQYALGRNYYLGLGVTKDLDLAYKWFKASADQKNPQAQYGVGLMHQNGEAVKADVDEAARWYQLAADQNNPEALYQLGVFYETGQSVTKDPERSANLYFAAAKAGNKLLQTTTTAQWDRTTLRALQRLLKEAGHYKGAIDGSMGPGTKRALDALNAAG